MYKYCKSLRKTIAALDEQGIRISRSGLQGIVARERETGSVRDRARSGRPKSLDSKEASLLVRIARANRKSSIRILTNKLKIRGAPEVSCSTISRVLKKKGYARRVAVKVPLLTNAQKEKRLAYALKYAKASLSFWKKVAFSDEKIFEGGAASKKCLVTRKSSERLSRNCVQLTPKRPVKVHVWGIINKYGMGPLRLVNGNLNSEKYQQEIIFDIEEICKVDPLHPRKGLIFQQDNAPAHSSRSTLNFMQAKRLSSLLWPGNSPDFNPIEHVWAHVSRRVRSRGLPSGTNQLWQWVEEEWYKTPLTYINKLYASLPRRLAEAASNLGGPTHY